MRSGLRVLLLWVMVLAMPVQGMAANLMLFCSPGHGHMGLAGVTHEMHAGHADQGLPDCHGSGSTDATAVADPAQPTPHGQFGCSACAACCAMLAIPARPVVPAQPEPAQPVASASPASLPSHLPDGLDRPPRAAAA